MTSSIGMNLAQQKARFRQQFGVDVLCADGKTRRMRTRSLEKREREYLPSGMENVADADLRVFEASPSLFQDAQGNPQWPASGSLLSWHGVSYTLLAVHPGDDEVGAVMITLLLFVYRTPQDDSETAETTAEAAASGQPQDAGKRKQY